MIASRPRKTMIVIGNGMVGQRFCEKLVEYDTSRQYRIVSFCEEPRAAYDRVGLTSFFAHRDAERLRLARKEWYRENGIELHIGDRAREIDRDQKRVRSDRGVEVAYDSIVLATGSYPFVPSIPGINNRGVFVYRTIEDLEHIITFARQAKRCAIIGGGLLGLEAARAVFELGLETHIIEQSCRLMPRQIDNRASSFLVDKIEVLGVNVHLNTEPKEVIGSGMVESIRFQNGKNLPIDMVVVSAGIRPRDDLAKTCGLDIGPRGGVIVNDFLETSDPDIHAIGECALHRSMTYGLVAPGYDMADIVAGNLCLDDDGADNQISRHQNRAGSITSLEHKTRRVFCGADMSTRLKLAEVDVASFGNCNADESTARAVTFEDNSSGVYKKILVSQDGTRLLGGVLVGDTSDFPWLSAISKSDQNLNVTPAELLLGPFGDAIPIDRSEHGLHSDSCLCVNGAHGRSCSGSTTQAGSRRRIEEPHYNRGFLHRVPD